MRFAYDEGKGKVKCMAETKPVSSSKMPHNIVVENRASVTATGVRAIVSYDAESATLDTDLGTLVVGGAGLTVSELSIRTGEVRIGGEIEYIQYIQPRREQTSLFRRLLR